MSKKTTKKKTSLPKNWENRDSSDEWQRIECNDCGIFIHYIHRVDGIEGYYDENGKRLNDDVREFSTDSFAEYLDLDNMPDEYEILCEECLEKWKPNAKLRNLFDKIYEDAESYGAETEKEIENNSLTIGLEPIDSFLIGTLQWTIIIKVEINTVNYDIKVKSEGNASLGNNNKEELNKKIKKLKDSLKNITIGEITTTYDDEFVVDITINHENTYKERDAETIIDSEWSILNDYFDEVHELIKD